MLHFARQRFYWPFMQDDIEHFVTKVCQCIKQRQPTFHTRDPLQTITITSPFEMVSINFLHLERSSGGYEYILVIMHHFTCFAQAYPTRNKSARTAAEKLYNDFLLHLGFPSKIHHNREESSRINFSQKFNIFATSSTHGQHLIIPKGMARWSTSTIPSFPCFEHSLNPTRPTGKPT